MITALHTVCAGVDFGIMLQNVPRGATMADSCFSGGLIDQYKEQIGPHHIHAVRSDNRASSHHRHEAAAVWYHQH